MNCPTYYTDNQVVLPVDPATASQIELNCLGYNMNLAQWKEYWNTGNCQIYFNNIMFNGDNKTRAFSKTGFDNVVKDYNYIFGTYFGPVQQDNDKGGHIITSPGAPNYDSFQDTLIDSCSNPIYSLQGACQGVAEYMCSNCSVNSLLSTNGILRLCGCQVSSLKDVAVSAGVTPACDPLCAQEQVSKKRNPETGEVYTCNQTVCVIDNISIVATGSDVSKVSFTQVCPQCSGSEVCRCIVDATIPSQYDSLGINNNFNQYCGTNSVCLTVDPTTGISKIVQCNIALANNTTEEYKIKIPIWVWITAIILIIISVIVLVACISVYKPNKINKIKTL